MWKPDPTRELVIRNVALIPLTNEVVTINFSHKHNIFDILAWLFSVVVIFSS